MYLKKLSITFGALMVIVGLRVLTAQGPARAGGAQGAGAPPPAGRAGGPGGAPQRPPVDPAIVERGRGLYSVSCASCHGSEARGGETGPNILRSSFVLDDQNGETLEPVVKAGRPEKGMPARPDLSSSQIADIATFLRTLRVAGRDTTRNPPKTIVVGEAAAGQRYFEAHCTSCHSATGDLKGVATKYTEPRQLQQVWLAGTAAGGRGAPPGAVAPRVTITVTLSSGEKVEGVQARLDDYIVSLRMPDGAIRTFTRNGDAPKVEVHDLLLPHRELVPTYTDADIHDVTAYLVTLK